MYCVEWCMILHMVLFIVRRQGSLAATLPDGTVLVETTDDDTCSVERDARCRKEDVEELIGFSRYTYKKI